MQKQGKVWDSLIEIVLNIQIEKAKVPCARALHALDNLTWV